MACMVTLDQIKNITSTALIYNYVPLAQEIQQLSVTPATDCCTVAGSGSWFSPSGSVVATSTSSATYQVRGNFFVDL